MDLKAVAKPREQILAFAVVLGLLVSFARVLYFPKRMEQTELTTKIKNLSLEKEALEKFTEALLKQPPKAKPEDLSPRIKILKGEMAPFAEETSLLLSQMTAPEFLKGITIKKMSDISPQKKNNYSQSGFVISAQGPFQNIYAFLERAEQFPALMMIDNVTLKALDSKASFVELELDGVLFHLEKK